MANEPRKSQPRYRIADGPDVDLDREVVLDVRGNRITEDSVAAAVERGHEHFDRVGRPAGRPSMSAPGKKSPAFSVRLPDSLKVQVQERAAEYGVKPAELVRDAIEAYLKSKP